MLQVDALLVMSVAGLAGLALVGGLATWAWAGWLRLRAREIDHGRMRAVDDLPVIGHRIDLADLKERIRKLEAIAAGVEI